MTRTLLHIGTTKTGTSSIQQVMHDRADVLAAAGVIYPLAGRDGGTLPAHHNLCYEFQEGRRKAGIFDPTKGTWKDAFEEIESSGADLALISSEAFSNCKPRQVEKFGHLLRDRDVHIVVYLRRQDRWLQSSWNQRARFGRAGVDFWSFYESVNDRLGRYDLMMASWLAAFGPERVSVRIYDNISPGSDAVQDLTETYMPGLALDARDQPRKNTKAGLKQIVAVSHITAECRDRIGSDFALATGSAIRISGFFKERPKEIYRYSVISYEQALDIHDHYDESNQRLFADVAPDDESLYFPLPRPEEFQEHVDVSETGLEIFDKQEQRFVKRMAREIIRAHRSVGTSRRRVSDAR